jgi:hypothetical protein
MSEATRKPAYVPNDALKETFSDGVTAVGFDGNNIRIELSISRIAQSSGSRETTVHPSARLIIPLNAAGDLLQKLGGAFADLERQEIVKKGVLPNQSGQPRN